MSMLSVQCDGLREAADKLEGYQCGEISRMLRRAADTIESLRDRLQAVSETCEFVDDSDGEPLPPKCSVCGYDPGIYECAWFEDGTYGYERNYCPNCGARVVSINERIP